MSGSVLRRRAPATGRRRIRPPHPSPSPRRRTSPAPRRSLKNSKPIKILKRCLSEPALCTAGGDAGDEDRRRFLGSENFLFPPHTYTDGFASSPSLLAFSPQQTSEVKSKLC